MLFECSVNALRRATCCGKISASGCYKTVLILETRFYEAGAAESLELGKTEVGASNRSGPLCKLYGISDFSIGRILQSDFTLGKISASGCYKTVVILETRF